MIRCYVGDNAQGRALRFDAGKMMHHPEKPQLVLVHHDDDLAGEQFEQLVESLTGSNPDILCDLGRGFVHVENKMLKGTELEFQCTPMEIDNAGLVVLSFLGVV